jgi:pre-mRNA-splicing factor ATP-dependent RNA helicase DHX15/PRP43
MLSVPAVFVRGKEKEKEAAEAAKKKFQSMDGDHLSMLNAFHAYATYKHGGAAYTTSATSAGNQHLGGRQMHGSGANTRDVEEWCRSHFLNHRSLASAESVRAQLENIMARLGIQVQASNPSDPEYYNNMRKALVSGFFTNVAHLQTEGKIHVQSICVLIVRKFTLFCH